MLITKAILTAYGVLLLSGAYFGKKAGSTVSLYMGLITGALVFLGIYLSYSNSNLGYGLIVGLSGLLIVTFLIRLIKTSKFMPSGMLLIVSLIAFVTSLLQLI